MIRGVIICFPSAGLPSRFNLRTSESLDFFARAVPVIKLPTPMAEAIAARLPISFLRPNIFEVIVNPLSSFSKLQNSYGKAKLKISLPAAMATYCLPLIA